MGWRIIARDSTRGTKHEESWRGFGRVSVMTESVRGPLCRQSQTALELNADTDSQYRER